MNIEAAICQIYDLGSDLVTYLSVSGLLNGQNMTPPPLLKEKVESYGSKIQTS
jgi:hypothetical protein